ncbi:MAG: CysS/YqeB C-terminal domain-containing protein [Acidimicrobiales bacterium]
MTRLLAILGSGETAPTMVKPHRQLFDRLGPGPVPAVLLDTPFGFQANADDISARAVEYFAASVGRKVEVAELRRAEGADPVGWEAGLAKLAGAGWAFAGPGSPTYALRQWAGTDVPKLLADKLDHGGCVVFASAAALTLGRFTVPVYEIYKVGADPAWAPGLALLGAIGDDVAVIPHYDNAEGGNHDTRFCYLGEPRLAALEEQMPAGGWVLGVDEHTGCIFDFGAGTATVVGRGQVTVRRHGVSSTVPSGETLPITDLVHLSRGKRAAAAPPAPTEAPAAGAPPTVLHAEIRRLEAEFDAAVGARDVAGAVRALLELDDTLFAWSGDTTQSDAGERGRAALRRMVVRLGELAVEGARDPMETVGPLVEALLSERDAARRDRRFADADRVRSALVSQGIEVRDTPDGTVWDLAGR